MGFLTSLGIAGAKAYTKNRANKNKAYFESQLEQRRKRDEQSAESNRNLGYSKKNAIAMAQGAPYRPLPRKLDESTTLGKKSRDIKAALDDRKSSSSSPSRDSAKSDAARQLQHAEDERRKEEQRITNSIRSGWADTGSVIDRAQQARQRAHNAVSGLGRVRDQVVSSLHNVLNRKNDAIAGNEELIQRNQKTALDNLAGSLRKEMDNANMTLGAFGASDGSAARAASRAIAQSAGRQRANIFTRYGDQFSQQRQARQQAQSEYDTARRNAYEWEQQRRADAEADLAEQGAALQELLNNKDVWQNDDVRARATQRLQAFLANLAQLTGNYGAIRSGIEDTMTEYGGRAEELDNAATNITRPAELDTPKFSTHVNIDKDTDDDWYDPHNKEQRRIVGYDIYGNPVYEDDLNA